MSLVLNIHKCNLPQDRPRFVLTILKFITNRTLVGLGYN